MAKFKPGDKVKSSVDGKTYIAMEESRPGYWWLADLDGRGNGLETREIDLTLANSVRSRNAKFKVGDKVVWLHFHSDSLSNETIKEVWKDGTYRVDSGFANERELYPGRVAKEAEGVTGMRDIGGGRFSTPHFPNKWFDLNGRVGSNSRACNSVRSRNAVVAKALNACAKNYAYSHDPIKLMIQYAKKEDYGGIMDITNPAEADSMGLYPADLVRRIYAKASKYYAGGRNMATPAQTQELVGLISGQRIKALNACARNAGGYFVYWTPWSKKANIVA
jgi:hypothetical protein